MPEGDELGRVEGCRLGLELGSADGLVEGGSEGDALGNTLGELEGATLLVGADDGMPDGVALGS